VNSPALLSRRADYRVPDDCRRLSIRRVGGHDAAGMAASMCTCARPWSGVGVLYGWTLFLVIQTDDRAVCVASASFWVFLFPPVVLVSLDPSSLKVPAVPIGP